MNFLPIENITYKTRLTLEEIVSRISESTEPEKMIRLGLLGGGPDKIYEGQVDTNTFRIKRIITYRNSFLPRIDGVIEKGLSGVNIRVKMRLGTFVIVFLCIWCSIVAFACTVTLPPALNAPEFDPAALIPCGMLVFVYVLTIGAFKFESTKSKKHLQRLFEAEIIRE